jgi:Peptidase family M1 domain
MLPILPAPQRFEFFRTQPCSISKLTLKIAGPRVLLFHNAQNDYTLPMRLAAAFFVLCGLTAAQPSPSIPRTAHQLYDALNSLRLDPASAYQIKPEQRIELRRGDAKISFDQGELIFFAPLDNQITGAVFSGRGHILALPRDTIEKQQMARFLDAPILDQDFASAYIRFTDTTSSDLLHQLQAAGLQPQSDSAAASRWEPVLSQLNAIHSLRVFCGTLFPTHLPYFYASLDGIATGPFDVVLDSMRPEPFLLGQVHTTAGSTFYDVWASYKIADIVPMAPDFRALHYAIDTSILPDHSLDATATVNLRALGAGQRFLIFALSRALNVESVTADGQKLEYFQNEDMTPQERSVRGNDFLFIVLPRPFARGNEFSIQFHYRGNIITDAGNDVFFVGARESWYPHFGDSADFAAYDLTVRWPRKLRLVATGTKIDEHDEADFRVGHWKTEKPVSVAGFNLGEYASSSVTSANYSIDVYANRQVEQQLAKRLANNISSEMQPAGPRRSILDMNQDLQPLPPNPTIALKQLGKDIDASIRFYETYGGPFPFRNLSVSQIPGTFGQGWPGLLYISTYSFLSADVQRRAGLSSSTQEHFTELVPFHEVAHQWWGNIVGWSSYRDQWIDEAIANYLALLFADMHKNPDHTLRVWLQRYRQRLIEKAPNADLPAGEIGALALGSRLNSSKSPEAYDDLIYAKGAWVIHMLREMLRQPGANLDARFNALLRTLVSKYAYRALSTQDLRREVEAVMTPSMDLEGGHSMEWFFEQWIQGTGIPHYRAEFTVHKSDSGAGYSIRGKLFQENVPQSFIARVPLYAAPALGARPVLLGTVVAAASETQFHFTSPTPPHKLLIDPQMTLLCTTQ